jgi:hypothetical protein
MLDPVHTKVTRIRNHYCVRVFYQGTLIMENNSPKTREDARVILKEMLRMVNKCGYDSPMADASKHLYLKYQE